MTVYATEDLVEVLIEFAVDREPQQANVPLAATPASELDGTDAVLETVDPQTPVLTHFYMPDAAGSVNAVFGVDLGTPAGGAQSRFISHPSGPDGITKRDDLAGVILVAVPPWNTETVRAYNRSGNRLDFEQLAAEPPVESVE